MRAVDTNVVVRLIARDDPKQVAAAEQFVASGAWVSHLVLAETTWVLASVYKLGAKQIATAIRMLLNHDKLALQSAEVIERALAVYLQQPKLGFSDCLIVEIARSAGHTPLGTFDLGLARVDAAVRV
ncbi:MAG: type II toxin-antitoxin system VapC family toxin [Proteobacteria bacterium]|nr:type II toxin-antitoxin system VapC family toxin [Pseudomonadota bacterium]